ncbi:hypothetical protein EV198_1585 [Roseivirga ehrenbergii]|nr:hypothetical protein EV198_1585 [Roseivirga ehrenbergii]
MKKHITFKLESHEKDYYNKYFFAIVFGFLYK